MKVLLRKAITRKPRLNLGNEMGHARFRLICGVIFSAFMVLAHALGQIEDIRGTALALAAFNAFGLAWLGVVGASLFTFKARRIASILLDQALFALALYLGGAALAPVMWAPVLMAIGNGLRNGPSFARLSALSGACFLSLATWLSPFWHKLPLVAEGLVLSVLILPWYAHLLSAQIARDKRELKLRAAQYEFASRTDSLTGLLNRSGFFVALESLLADVGSKSIRGAVMLLDLDGFKAINDTCGHSAGDAALKEIGMRLMRYLSNGDRAARIGGDEFGIALVDTASHEEVEQLAQELVEAIAAIRVPGAPELRLGASIGICLLPDERFITSSAIMEETDRLMYQAKRAGKNRFRSSRASAAAEI
ncbi:diguanylate cyclase [Noviherbaspirillum sp. UKPF54]|uniref:GGDEF domain-containing protein n=1 Tax=Noviherbaspirillum sp. UKPF54 TaxID=2601898 RepID=UPI0011B19B9E|nr:GGDEF domain-containing protein [Noviherbaspirillum sp. UKPF54]QDZ29961.1 GGDEF domain-containing protein [Noviherbaspirillum sp. UKPF54]